jgi:predicted permease
MLWLRRIHHVLRRRRFEADLEEELALHLELKQQALREQGVPAEVATVESRRAFGSATLAADQSRDIWTWRWLSDVARDVRFARRLLAKDVRFTLSSVVALALGIGATTTVFVFINTALFKDLPFDQPRELMALGTTTVRTAASNETVPRRQGVSYPDFVEWRTASTAFAALAADLGATVNLSDDDHPPVRARGSYVSGNLFGLLRVRATAGRTLVPDDDRPDAPLALVLGHDIWQRRFHGDVGAVGRHVRVNGTPAVIVGVMPSAFRFPGTSELWLPLTTLPTLGMTDRARRTLNVTGRLPEGRSVARALAELTSVAERLEHDFPETNTGVRPTVAPPLDVVRRGSAPLLYALFGAVCFVLLISCANVAMLLLARASARAREMSIRASLGATRGRLVGQLLIESLTLATLGGVVGVAIAFAGVHVFGVAFDTVEIAAPTQATTPYWVDLSMDARVLAFITLLCLGVAVAAGVIPALQLSRADLKERGRGAVGGRRAGRWMDALMVLELALTVVLLSGAGLLVRSFVTQYRADLVVDTRVWSARLTLPAQTYATPEQQDAFLARFEARLAADRRLTSVAFGSDIPIAPLTRLTQPMLLDSGVRRSTSTPVSVSAIRVGAHYFETLGVGAVAGRLCAASTTFAGWRQLFLPAKG